MPHLTYLKVIYGLVGLTWFAYWTFQLLRIPSADRNPNPMALVDCLLLFAAIPALGYILLFKILPWTGQKAKALLNRG